MEEKLSSSATSCNSAFNFLLTDLRLKSLTSRLLHLRQNLVLILIKEYFSPQNYQGTKHCQN